MEERIEIQGVVENIIYHNPENGYTVFSVISAAQKDAEDEEITCVAYMGQINAGESVQLVGGYILHPSYGRQFNVQSFQKSNPTSLFGIEKYLGSGAIKGVGEKLARKIVAKFKEDTLKIIEEMPEKLSEIKGITLEKAITIGNIFNEQAVQRRAIIFLQEYGISPAYAVKIYNKYKENTITVVKNNPYRLADDIFGIGFHIADSIAYKAGFDLDSPFRIKAGIRYALSQSTNNGHVYLPKPILIGQAAELLSVNNGLIENNLLEMQMERALWQEKIGEEIAVYLNAFHFAESFTAKKLLQISNNFLPENMIGDQKIEAIEKEEGVTLAETQKTAIIEALSSGVLVINGGPGTGKTTAIRTIIKILEEEELKIELAAPTGRAAKRMAEATGREAKTIHRLLGMSFADEDHRRQYFDKDEDNEIDADVIIIDETSMVDIVLMHHLLKAVPPGARLILVGDADQLPSVGPGNVLKDIIKSGAIKVNQLTEIFRQAQESAIIINAHRINRGEYPLLNEKNKDFFLMRRPLADDVIKTIVALVSERLPKYMSCDSFRDIQVLTPMRKGALGVANLNIVLQNALNPANRSKNEKEYRSLIFREGDKVMQIRNNYNIAWRGFDKAGRQTDEGVGVYNGDEGIIMKIDDIDETVMVAFDDGKVVWYDYSQLEELELSYAVTIHKSQGSEYKAVIIPVHSGPPMLLSRNLLYTAVTRAKNLVVLVGTDETLCRMVDNIREVNRYSALTHRLVKMKNFIVVTNEQ
jgi:exodeoxyribonuclease V alpha subunit